MGNENNCVSKLVWGLDQTIEVWGCLLKPASLWLNILIQYGPSQLQFASDHSLSKTHSKKRHDGNFSNAGY